MSFLKELEKLNRPAPTLPDLEDNDVDGTSSKANKFTKSATDQDEVVINRRRIIPLHVDEDGKYGGSTVSRSEMFGDSSGIADIAAQESDDSDEDIDDEHAISEENDSEEHMSDEQDDEESDISDSEFDAALNGTKISDTADQDDEEGFSDEEDEGDESNEEPNESAEDGEDDTPVQDLMSKVDKMKENKRADAVRTQLNIWDQLLYMKIKTHAALRAFNQLPREKMARDLLKESTDETKSDVNKSQKNSLKLLNILLEAENLLLAGSSLTKGLVGGSGGMVDSDDEEIESSEDEADEDGREKVSEAELSDDDDKSDEEKIDGTEKNRPLSAKAASKKLVENDKVFAKFRNSTLTKWDERTRLTGPRSHKEAKKDFSAFENNVVKQIDKIMADKARMLKRCHTKRSDIERIGGDPQADEDPEIYDDDDFYQVLLKEMIDKKTSQTNDPATMTRHYIEMQKLKNKRSKKRVFDKNLSKDRSIKYVTIPKLVNFHPAQPEFVPWAHETRNELFKSLFA